jgi:hypothetical protein
VAVWSIGLVCAGCSLVGIAGSNPAMGMYVYVVTVCVIQVEVSATGRFCFIACEIILNLSRQEEHPTYDKEGMKEGRKEV